MTGPIATRLQELGLRLPEPAAAVANYVPFVVTGNLVFVSGQLPLENGKVAVAGYLWKADPQITFFGAAEIIWFVLRTLAAQGVWMAAAHAWSPRMPRDARARVLVLAAPALAAAAFPQGAVAVAAVTALVLAAREWRFERVE